MDHKDQMHYFRDEQDMLSLGWGTRLGRLQHCLYIGAFWNWHRDTKMQGNP